MKTLIYIECLLNICKNKEKIQKFNEAGDSRYIYENQLDKACFQFDMAYGDFKDLTRRTAFYKILGDTTFNIAKNPIYYGYQRGIVSMVYKFFDKKSSGGAVKNSNMSNPILSKLHKPVITKLKNQKVYSSFIDNIWGTDLAGMELFSKCNK